jgi:hypothetical protein
MKAENFAEWMRTKVKSVHYANNNAMMKAFAKLDKENLKKENYRFNLQNQN